MYLAISLETLAFRLELTLSALDRVHGAVQAVDDPHHLAKPASSDVAEVHEIRPKSRHGGELRGGDVRILAADPGVRGYLRGLLIVVEECVAVARRGLGRLDDAGAGGRARRGHPEQTFAFGSV